MQESHMLFLHFSPKMVSRVEEAMKRRQKQVVSATKDSNSHQHHHHHNQQQQQKQIQSIQCNKGKVPKFKRSSSNLEEDGASSAILILACIACAPSFSLL
ncbi:hypothetical protein Dimus_004637 [Dionaea muscipula]